MSGRTNSGGIAVPCRFLAFFAGLIWENTLIKENSIVFSQVLDEDLALKFRLVKLKRATSSVLIRLVIADLAPHLMSFPGYVIGVKKHHSHGGQRKIIEFIFLLLFDIFLSFHLFNLEVQALIRFSFFLRRLRLYSQIRRIEFQERLEFFHWIVFGKLFFFF